MRLGVLDETKNNLEYVLALKPAARWLVADVGCAACCTSPDLASCAGLPALAAGRGACAEASRRLPVSVLTLAFFVPQDLMERRLQTQVLKLGLAKSIHHARVLIRQRHIRVGKQIVNIPSFMVRIDSQKHIDFAVTSPYGGGRPGRNKRKSIASKGGGGGGGDDEDME